MKTSRPWLRWAAVCAVTLGGAVHGVATAQETGPDAPAKPVAATLPADGVARKGDKADKAKEANKAEEANKAGKAAEVAGKRVNINEYVVRGNTVLDVRTIEKAVTPYLGPERTLADIEAARDALLAAYQAKGYQSVYVGLPEQQVTGGVVYLKVSETRLGRLRVVGSEYHSPHEVRERVPSLAEGKVPDFSAAQAELTALNRTGDQQVVPLVKQGAVPGTMDVDLKVEDTNPWRASLSVNNDRSADTKPLRMLASLGYDNLWQLGHRVSMSFFGAPQDFRQSKVWSGSYVAPLGSSPWTLELNGYTSDSNVATTGGTTVLGKGHAIGVKTTYTVPDTGSWYHAFSLGVDFKDNTETTRFGTAGDVVPLKYAPITVGYSGFYQSDQWQLGLNTSIVTGTSSLFGYGSSPAQFDAKRYKASPSFTLLRADANGAYTFGGGWQLAARIATQMTDSPLVSNEQLAGGGMNSVRGYLSAEATGDYGVVGSVEWRTPPIPLLGPLVSNWRAYAFFDGARLGLRDPLPEQTSRFSLASVGVGTSLRLTSHVTGRFDAAYPLTNGPRTQRYKPRLNFSVTATY
ncbi:ShlB/FhaC/HecB family hemolysin secretion/activation protein [Pandoraea nosoerga]|nr:ShlB/FhaC/HecB family hemolysin secretion/activation protein [Pandoraea nosoerga]MBN4677227.1 ShlB/FhaC/HecB family hemolysin secretion/activation protein [Pandoraea nosoerga]MBN4681951.1 ShlB/FhaC/HecB family hemolysin secretion/activation protein [Pandoraea nosoerga]MBN4746269.1 ShlB/FhaC/HecB family hemolysin secretion/activation protein [Pandoraea nosoerga]